MTLENLFVDLDVSPLPARVSDFLSSASEEESDFRSTESEPNARFHSSNFQLVYGSLQQVLEAGLLGSASSGPGRLCEWGAGLAVTSGMWSLLGGEAWAIELDERLIQRARKLHEQYELTHVHVRRGNYLPVGSRQFVDEVDDLSHMTFEGQPPYGSGVPPLGSFDVIFVYPWPGEIRMLADIFDHYARSGALLLGFMGADELYLWRKK